MKSKNIVYLAHGGQKYTKQAIFSLYSLLYWLKEEPDNSIGIIVYTDDDTWVPRHELITARTISPEQIRQYKGKHQYTHRVKLEILRHAQSMSSGPILFVDCDTQWIKTPSPALRELAENPKMCWMHQLEGKVSIRNHPDYFTLLSENPSLSQNFPPPWEMWNSGAIGIPEGNRAFFSETLETCDQILDFLPHNNWVEQLAVSLQATKQFETKSLEPYLLHFWRDSPILPEVLEKALSNLSDDAGSNAKLCATFPVEEELRIFRESLKGQWLRKKAKWKRSLSKRRNKFRSWIQL